MLTNMGSDAQRYRYIIEGRVRDNLKKSIKDGGFSIDHGNGIVRIPVPIIEIPRFMYGNKSAGGVGQGEGEKGDPIFGDAKNGGAGHGDEQGSHEYVEFDRNQFAKFLIDTFNLQNMRDVDQSGAVLSRDLKYDSVAPVGVLRHPRRTIMKALRRNLASGSYIPGQSIDIREYDTVYRYPSVTQDPTQNAVIAYLLDISGSTEPVLNYLKMAAYATDCLIGLHYPKVDRFYVQYDDSAKESEANKFYTINARGGTNIRAGYEKVMDVVTHRYPPSSYNLYLIHLTDGDAHGIDTTISSLKRTKEGVRNSLQSGSILTDSILSAFNCVYVVEAGAFYGSANFSTYLGRLAKLDSEISRRLRFTTYNKEQIDADPKSWLSATMRTFFT